MSIGIGGHMVIAGFSRLVLGERVVFLRSFLVASLFDLANSL